jgi:hypothetical protein
MLGARLRRRHIPIEVLLLGIVLLEAGFTAYYAVKGTHWAVMTDELQNSKLATSISHSGSPLPMIHGERYGASSQLYPLLIAPFYGFLSGPGAVTASHALNAVLMASAAWPAYILARAVTGSRAGAWVAAVLTALVPWTVLTTALLTENVAYPVFLWAVVAIHRSLASSGDKRGLVTVLSIIVAFFTRTQFFLLALIVPLALLVHEVAFAATRERGGRKRLLAAAVALRGAVSRQRVLAGASLLGAVVATGLAASDRLGSVLGNYGTTLRGGLLPAGLWHAAADHLNRVVVGIGIVPFLLATAWAIATLIRPATKQAHGFAVLLLLLAPLLTFQVASFDLRFTPGAFAQERYLFYVAPLLFVGMVACLLDRGQKILQAGLLLALALLFPWLAGLTSYRDTTVIYWASPASAFHDAIATAAGWLSLSADSLIRWGGAVIAAALAAAVFRGRPRPTLAVVGFAIAVFCFVETRHVFVHDALPAVTRPSEIPATPRDWIDDAVPEDASVALVPNPYLGAEIWWDAEFWNKSVDRVLRVEGSPTYTPFSADEIKIDFSAGELRGSTSARLLVQAVDETRFHLADTAVITAAPPLVLVRAGQQFRLEWAVRGIFPDGWTVPNTAARLRFFPRGNSRRLQVNLTLASAREAEKAQVYRLVAAGRTVHEGTIAPGKFRRLTFAIAAAPHAFTEARLVVPHEVQLGDGRLVGLHIDRIAAFASR